MPLKNWDSLPSETSTSSDERTHPRSSIPLSLFVVGSVPDGLRTTSGVDSIESRARLFVVFMVARRFDQKCAAGSARMNVELPSVASSSLDGPSIVESCVPRLVSADSDLRIFAGREQIGATVCARACPSCKSYDGGSAKLVAASIRSLVQPTVAAPFSPRPIALHISFQWMRAGRAQRRGPQLARRPKGGHAFDFRLRAPPEPSEIQ